jgi:phosphoribosylaminoimidazole-succinocarboxamide synthase
MSTKSSSKDVSSPLTVPSPSIPEGKVPEGKAASPARQDVIIQSELPGIPLVNRGKVRDLYDLGEHLLLLATDRLSAFDVVLPDPIPDKGRVLNEMANFWFGKLGHVVPNQLTGIDPESVVSPEEKTQVRGRSVVVKKLKPLPIEAVVRGYIIGSGWKDYQKSGKVCGIELPKGLQQAQKLPEPIFTPATKAETGHDENISFAEVEKKIGKELAAKVRDVSIRLYKEASDYARTKGIIIADTKFEFGLDPQNQLVLIDEVLTADSSRFWPADSYQVGMSPPSYDKQFVRDYLESLTWDKTPPAPKLPEDVIARTSQKYRDALERLTGRKLS